MGHECGMMGKFLPTFSFFYIAPGFFGKEDQIVYVLFYTPNQLTAAARARK